MDSSPNRNQHDNIPNGEVKITESPKGCGIRSIITVEPVVFLYFIGLISYMPTLQQYVYAELSRQYGFTPVSTDNCSQGSSDSSDLENEVQSASSQFMMIMNAVCLPTGFLMTTFLGHYSDFRGRRLAMIMPCVGGALRAFLSMLVVYFQLNLYYLVGAAILESLFGGTMSIIMATFAYISDVSTSNTRSMRILIVEMGIGLGVATGTITTGYMIKLYGFLISFLFSLAAYTLNAIFCATYVKESVRPSSEPVRFFSVGHIRETIQIFTMDNGRNRRWKLLLLLFMVILQSTVDIGSSDVSTFFLLDSPLCFTSVLIGYYQSATWTVKAIGAVILMKLLHSCFKDTGLIILGCIAGIAAQLLLAFSHDLFMVFMGKCSSFNTLRPRQMAAIFQTTFSNAFSWMKMY